MQVTNNSLAIVMKRRLVPRAYLRSYCTSSYEGETAAPVDTSYQSYGPWVGQSFKIGLDYR